MTYYYYYYYYIITITELQSGSSISRHTVVLAVRLWTAFRTRRTPTYRRCSARSLRSA